MQLVCPHCRSGLAVPDGTFALVRCPTCQTVFAPADNLAPEPEPEEDEEDEEPEPAPTLSLVCPNCRSGLQVPAGTTALVRCPACQTVFAPADNAAPEPEDEKPKARKPARDEPRPKRRKPLRAEEAEEEEEDEEPRDDDRDFVPLSKEEAARARRRKRKAADDTLTLAEKISRRRAFDRAAWGCRLIWISFVLFMVSMLCIGFFFFQYGISMMVVPTPAFITVSGVLGLAGWVVAAVGVGLCLSGPVAPGHWGYGISAAVVTGIHLVFLMALVSQNKEYCVGRSVDRAMGESSFARWSMLSTRLDATMFYLTAAVYPKEQGAAPREPLALSMITGVLEMVRTVLIMMLLSCLARAALDEDLAAKCTRTAGIVSGGPGLVALLMLAFVGFVVETGAGLNLFTIILFSVVNMGVYFILIAVMLPAYLVVRDVTDACEEPFQSLIPNL